MSGNRQYYRVMLGKKSKNAQECYAGKWIGGDWGFNFDLSESLSEDWRAFRKKMTPIFLENHPDKSKVAAGLAGGMLWTLCKGLQQGDVVLCPDGQGNYYTGEIASNYFYKAGENLPHRRKVEWHNKTIARSEMSEGLQNSTGSIGTLSNIDKHAEEIDRLVAGVAPPKIISTDELIEDPSVFALEKHLEDFLVKNWSQTSLGRTHDIFEDDGELVGQQYLTDTGPIDILAISKDRKELLIVELKKGRASDAVVGQIQRYMGYVLEELTETGQTVRGVIIALDDDLRLRRSLSVARNIEFFRYQVSFKLIPGNTE
jgi:endonuclease NucS-like protein